MRRAGNPKGRRLWVIAAVFLVGLLAGRIFFGGGGSNGPAGETTEEHASHDEATLWTCSMHPQIKLPEPGKCPICFMDLIPLDTGAGDTSPTRLAMSEASLALAEIATTPVVRRAVEGEVRTVGKVAVDERRLRRITAWVGGRIDHVHVDFTGTSVRKGDPLVELYSPELYSAQTEYVQAIEAQGRLGESHGTTLRETAETTVRASRERLRLLGLSDAQIAGLEKSGAAKEWVTIHAPIGGIVVHKNAVEGEYVKTGTPIYTIADLTHVWILLDAYESDLSWIREGRNVSFDVEAFPGETFTGRITFVDPLLDPKTRTVKVRVEAPNPRMILKPDMFVRARIETPAMAEEPLVIPVSAPLRTGKRAVVYVRVPGTEKPTFEGRQVVLGPRAGGFIVVESGLAEGELVVVKGNFKIDSEMQIQAKSSMMSPEGGVPPPVHDHGAMEEPPRRTAPTSLTPVYDAYLALQRALAADDAAAARKALARADWDAAPPDLRREIGEARSTDDLERLRIHFDAISKQVIALEREVGPPVGATHRLAFCPMAFDNRGAHWIQTEEEIANPYFGEMMLRCGEFQAVFEGAR